MRTSPLIEYRCQCGKLLFKGLLFTSVVEVKCRRCGHIFSTERFSPETYVLVECDSDFTITAVSPAARHVLQYEPDELVGQPANRFFSLASDTELVQGSLNSSERTYAMTENTCTLKDGGVMKIKSYVIPKWENNQFTGYRLLHRPLETAS
jgi:PAS domain-containing protein